jgi:hypothetical protein
MSRHKKNKNQQKNGRISINNKKKLNCNFFKIKNKNKGFLARNYIVTADMSHSTKKKT